MGIPAWTLALHPPTNLPTSQRQTNSIVSFRKNQAITILNAMAFISEAEAKECKSRAEAATWALRAYYQQPVASVYNLDEALDAMAILSERAQKLFTWNNKSTMLNCVGSPL